jgi:hypothetical protein
MQFEGAGHARDGPGIPAFPPVCAVPSSCSSLCMAKLWNAEKLLSLRKGHCRDPLCLKGVGDGRRLVRNPEFLGTWCFGGKEPQHWASLASTQHVPATLQTQAFYPGFTVSLTRENWAHGHEEDRWQGHIPLTWPFSAPSCPGPQKLVCFSTLCLLISCEEIGNTVPLGRGGQSDQLVALTCTSFRVGLQREGASQQIQGLPSWNDDAQDSGDITITWVWSSRRQRCHRQPGLGGEGTEGQLTHNVGGRGRFCGGPDSDWHGALGPRCQLAGPSSVTMSGMGELLRATGCFSWHGPWLLLPCTLVAAVHSLHLSGRSEAPWGYSSVC